MNKKQEAAALRLQKALDNCHKQGLRGGVYEYRMRVWPIDAPDPHEAGTNFFEVINEHGQCIMSQMTLDGGAGI